VVEKRWLTVFIVTCALGLAVGLDLFQLHVHSVIPCLCSLPTEPSPGLQLGDFTFVQGELIFSNPLIYSVSHWGAWSFVWGPKPTQDPRSNMTGYQQTSISKTVLPNQARWDIGLLDAQQWLQSVTIDGNCVEQLYSLQPLRSCTTVSINALFNISLHHNRIYISISFTLALGSQTKVLASNSSKWEQHFF